MQNKADYFSRHFDEICLSSAAKRYVNQVFSPTLDCAASARNSIAAKFISWEVNFLLLPNSTIGRDERVFLHPPQCYHVCVVMVQKFLLLPNKKALVLAARYADIMHNLLKQHNFVQITLDSSLSFCTQKYPSLEPIALKVPEKHYFLYQT